MSASVEREIRLLFNDLGAADLVADELVRRWRKHLFSEEQQKAVAQFLLNAGFTPKLLFEIRRLLDEERPIPWAQFAEAVHRARIAPGDAAIRALLEGLEEQNAFVDILRCKHADAWHRTLQENRAKEKARKAMELAEKKTALRQRLQFFRTNRMYNEESATLDQLRAMFPEDPEFARQEDDLAERWAREILSTRGSTLATDMTEELHSRARALSPEQKSIKDLIVRQCLEKATRTAEQAYDLALLLVFMEFYAEAVETLDLAPNSPAVDWLRLELLLKARQYVSVLDETTRIEIAYAGEPEATFAVIYARARALWGLGQAAMAIDLMRSIVSVRPHYKSAMSLLVDWSGGEL